MSGNARLSALNALEKCRRNGAFSDDVLRKICKADNLGARDTALCFNICFGVLQNMTLCDFYISAYSSIRAEKLQPKVLDILRISVYQLLFLDRIPARAVVSEGVELCKLLGYAKASGLVNAVLRKISYNLDNLPEIPGKGTGEYISVKYSTPKWLVDEIIASKGYDFAEGFFRENNTPVTLTAQTNTAKLTTAELRESLLAEGIESQMHPWLKDCLLIKNAGDISRLESFKKGYFYIQDPAARFAVKAADIKSGMSVLDACAAPGGKSFAAAVDMNGKGSITSCDIREKKLPLIDEGAERLGFSGIINTVAMDGRKPYSAMEEKFDVVIADVPCSGLGVIRKKPEIRFKTPEEIERLPEIQKDILSALSACVKPGGILLYSTCTVRQDENEGVIKAFLALHPEFSAVEFELPEIFGAERHGMHTFWPNVEGTDGFFVCKMIKQ